MADDELGEPSVPVRLARRSLVPVGDLRPLGRGRRWLLQSDLVAAEQRLTLRRMPCCKAGHFLCLLHLASREVGQMVSPASIFIAADDLAT